LSVPDPAAPVSDGTVASSVVPRPDCGARRAGQAGFPGAEPAGSRHRSGHERSAGSSAGHPPARRPSAGAARRPFTWRWRPPKAARQAVAPTGAWSHRAPGKQGKCWATGREKGRGERGESNSTGPVCERPGLRCPAGGLVSFLYRDHDLRWMPGHRSGRARLDHPGLEWDRSSAPWY